MSMVTTTIIQMVELFGAYLCLTILLPHFVLGKTLKLKNRYEKFMLYSMAGNFYAMNLVFILELLHIAYPFVIIVLTVVPCFLIKIKLEKIPVRDIWSLFVKRLEGIAGGQLKVRALWRNGGEKRKEVGRNSLSHFVKVYVMQLPDVILTFGLLVAVFYVFGSDHLVNFGYKASDIIVHNYWINCMGENNIFCTGIYPYGFHCIVFYLKSVFGIDTFVILRLMAFVQTVWDILILLCFLKLLCKSAFSPYIGTYLYVLAGFFRMNTYSRYAASLPQEYGMMFILPAIYCLFGFFREQRHVDRGSISRRWKMYLGFFSISFAMTLSVHFYGTMIAGLFCVAVACGYALWFFRGRYVGKIILAGLMALVVSIAPMGIAYIGGTPLQASLGWGLSVINGNGGDPSGIEVGEPTKDDSSVPYDIEVWNAKDYSDFGAFAEVAKKIDQVKNCVYTNIINISEEHNNVLFVILLFAPMLLLVGTLCLLFKRRDTMYGATVISCGFFMILMLILIAIYYFPLPAIMDNNRSSVYFSYFTGLWLSLLIDSVIYLIGDYKENSILRNVISALCMGIVVGGLLGVGSVRTPLTAEAFEMNDAIITLSEIMKEEKNFSWTIVSANDENRMAYDSGYHYEILTFLQNMEHVGANGMVLIPTESVYFFVEKIPVDYMHPYWGSGQHISEEGCNNSLPYGTGISVYEAENRWIIMSRAYAWAQEFKSLYPNEVSVFYETDEFVCYRIEQNPYRLFNFSIDYGYNMKSYPNRTEEE